MSIFALAFLISRNNKHIYDVGLSNQINTGIRFYEIPGCVPIYLEVQACNAANYQYFDTWQELTPQQRSFLIAHFLSVRTVENNIRDAEYKEAKK
jgi:hypothetical protein